MVVLRISAAAICALGLLTGCGGSTTSSTPAVGALAMSGGQATARALQPDKAGRVLYVGDIDGSPPGVGQILVYTASPTNPQLIRSITNGTGRPFGMWVDDRNILYAANYPNKMPSSVSEFRPGASAPFRTLTVLKGYPESVAVDSRGDVFVNESYSNHGYIQEFGPGQTLPKRTIDTGVSGYAFQAGGMAFDPKGNLIAAESADIKLQVLKIAKDTLKVSSVDLDLTNVDGPALGIDRAGNFYVTGADSGTIEVYAPGQREPTRTISNVLGYGYSSVTADGTVYQASGESLVSIVAPGASAPTATFSCECGAMGVALSK